MEKLQSLFISFLFIFFFAYLFAATTGIEYLFFTKHQMRRCFCKQTYRMIVRNIHPFAKFILPSQFSVEVSAPIIDKNKDDFAEWCI